MFLGSFRSALACSTVNASLAELRASVRGLVPGFAYAVSVLGSLPDADALVTVGSGKAQGDADALVPVEWQAALSAKSDSESSAIRSDGERECDGHAFVCVYVCVCARARARQASCSSSPRLACYLASHSHTSTYIRIYTHPLTSA